MAARSNKFNKNFFIERFFWLINNLVNKNNLLTHSAITQILLPSVRRQGNAKIRFSPELEKKSSIFLQIFSQNFSQGKSAVLQRRPNWGRRANRGRCPKRCYSPRYGVGGQRGAAPLWGRCPPRMESSAECGPKSVPRPLKAPAGRHDSKPNSIGRVRNAKTARMGRKMICPTCCFSVSLPEVP